LRIAGSAAMLGGLYGWATSPVLQRPSGAGRRARWSIAVRKPAAGAWVMRFRACCRHLLVGVGTL
jgi:hypothetical protein